MDQIMKKIMIAMMGPSKSGKTTFIQAIFDMMVSARSVNYLGSAQRTAVVVDYIFAPEASEMRIEKVYPKFSAITGGGAKKFNELLQSEDGKILRRIGIEPFDSLQEKSTATELREHIEKCLQVYCEEHTGDIETIFEVLTIQKLDSFVERIEVSVPANDRVRQYLIDNNLELTLRDTRGLLDIQSKKEDGKRTISDENLTSVGLDKLDAVLFFTPTEFLQNCVMDLHGEVLKNVLESVPVFGIAKCSPKITPDVDDINESFAPLFDLLSGRISSEKNISIDVLKESSKPDGIDYEFKNPVAAMDRMLHFIPKLKPKSSRDIADGKFDVESDEWTGFQNAVTNTIENISTTLMQYRKAVHSLVSQNEVTRLLYDEKNCWHDLAADMKQYEDGHNCKYFKVGSRTNDYSHEKLNQSIKDPTVYNDSPIEGKYIFLGPRQGLTSVRNRKWICPQTGIGAVAAYEYLWERCCQSNNLDNISEEVKKSFQDLGLNENDLTYAIQRLLKFLIYRIGTEETVMFSNKWCVNRYTMASALLEVRNSLEELSFVSPFLAAVERCIAIIANQCNDIDNIEQVFFGKER